MPREAKRSVSIAGHRTSISLEDEFWTALNEIARARGQTVSRLIAVIDESRAAERSRRALSSAIRVFVLNELRRERTR